MKSETNSQNDKIFFLKKKTKEYSLKTTIFFGNTGVRVVSNEKTNSYHTRRKNQTRQRHHNLEHQIVLKNLLSIDTKIFSAVNDEMLDRKYQKFPKFDTNKNDQKRNIFTMSKKVGHYFDFVFFKKGFLDR